MSGDRDRDARAPLNSRSKSSSATPSVPRLLMEKPRAPPTSNEGSERAEDTEFPESPAGITEAQHGFKTKHISTMAFPFALEV